MVDNQDKGTSFDKKLKKSVRLTLLVLLLSVSALPDMIKSKND